MSVRAGFAVWLVGAAVLFLASACVDFSEKPAALESYVPGDDIAVNPNPGDVESAARGGLLFGQNCVRCHGPQAKGDGPEGLRLPSRPANLTAPRIATLRDGDLFRTITEGRGYMPSWRGRLSDSEIWDLVNFIRTLSEGAE